MPPVETPGGHVGMMTTMPGPAQGPSGATISLSTLIEYIIQRTYHELTVLSELLPRKTDMERKIEIVQFANRTRQLFVRLLALVKWATSASKVDKCAMISSFLDQQAMLFVETADHLARMSRETLVHARLPSFSLPCAIDVLTTGTYPRLPACIKEKIVPPDPITPVEKRQTLQRLDQIIEHRLVTGQLPSHMRKPRIGNGRVKFTVEHEFEVTLTLMGEGGNIPWRLLDIEILVEDPETGDGKALVHSLQVNYIHQLIQSRLMENDRPLFDLYNCLHSFCQSLQLEVLHSQAQRLIRHRLGEYVRTEEYGPGKTLCVSYWRDPSKREGKPVQTIYKLSIHMDDTDPARPLQVSHFPQIQGSESTRVAQAIRSDLLSFEKLLMHTIQVRSLAKLKELEREFRIMVAGTCEIRDLPSMLYVPALHPCMPSERLCIAVDSMKGMFTVSIAQKETQLTNEIEECVNRDRRELRRAMSRLRLWLGLQRCERSVQHLQMACLHNLPLTVSATHPLNSISRHKLFIRVAKQNNIYLVVEAVETRKRGVDYIYHLLHVTPHGLEGEDGVPPPPNDAGDTHDLPLAYFRADHMMKLDPYSCTHGPYSQLYDSYEDDPNPLVRKRKLLLGDDYEPPGKKRKTCAYFVSELTHILAMCEDRIPLVLLGEELQKQGVAHQGVQVDGEGACLSLTLLNMPTVSGITAETMAALNSALLALRCRIQRRVGHMWVLEAMLTNCPVQTAASREQGKLQRVHFFYDLVSTDHMEGTVQALFNDWATISHLYQAVLDFAAFKKTSPVLQKEIDIKSYTYKRITLAYGPNKCYSVTVQYNPSTEQFQLAFATMGQTCIANCHTVITTQLQRQFNLHRSLAQLSQTLIDTWSPLCSLGKLSTAPFLTTYNKGLQPVPGFTAVPQSPTHMRLIFRNNHCIDIHCQTGRLVSVRDGAYSMFDTSTVVEGLSPIPALKAFLTMYADDASAMAARRRSTNEDDNPPTPKATDPTDFLGSGTIASPAAQVRGGKQDSMRYHGPLTPPSNPHTPASPAQPRHAQQIGSSPGSAPFPLSSPPSLITPSPSNVMAPSPSNPSFHAPSPSSFLAAPSPSTLGMHMMPSPAQAFLSTGASVLSPPSRLLPQRAWAAAIPTLLSHDGLDKLLTPCTPPGATSGESVILCSPLERFLCSIHLKKIIQRMLNSEDFPNVKQVAHSEPGVVAFRTESLQMAVSLSPATLQSLHLNVSAVTEHMSEWDTDEIKVLEHFFETRVVCPPYKTHTLSAFCRILGAPHRVLKDCVQLMRLEMAPEEGMKWGLQWCLTIPQGSPIITQVGAVGVHLRQDKILFLLQLSRLGQQTSPNEPTKLIVPILYTVHTNTTTTLEQRSPGQASSPVYLAVFASFKRFTEFNSKPGDCTLYPAIRELLSSLTLGAGPTM